MPKFAALMVLFALANSGLPATSGFVGEFLVIVASFKANIWYSVLAGTTLVLGASYTLWLVKRVIFGPIANDGVASLQDLNAREFLVLGVLAIAVLLLGVWPAPLLDSMPRTVQPPAAQMTTSKLGIGRMDFTELNLVPAYAELFVLGATCLILLIDLFLSDKQ